MLRDNDMIKFIQDNKIIEKVGLGATINGVKDDKFNFMAISWATVGILWNRPVINVYVRECRNTYDSVQDEFTISLSDKTEAEVMKIAGTMSGRDVNKVELLKPEFVDSKIINVPGYKQMPFTLECKVLHKMDFDWDQIPEEAKKIFHEESNEKGLRENGLKDYHTVFTAEIVNCYIAK